MTLKVQLRPAAEADLVEIWDYTVQIWSRQQAATYLSGLGQAFERLAVFPEMSRLREELTPPVRIFPFQRHLIIYVIKAETLDIIRVPHNRANWAGLLSE